MASNFNISEKEFPKLFATLKEIHRFRQDAEAKVSDKKLSFRGVTLSELIDHSTKRLQDFHDTEKIIEQTAADSQGANHSPQGANSSNEKNIEAA